MTVAGKLKSEVFGSNFSSGPASPMVLPPRALGMQMKLHAKESPKKKDSQAQP